MTTAHSRDRLAEAAFGLFAERGYEATTVEDIADRAASSRATFFRHYRSKEDVVFPDHDGLLERVRARLDSSNQQTALAAVSDAVRLVLLNYVAEGDRAKVRYELTSSVPALRDREIASVAPYQRLFREFIAAWIGDIPDAALRAELMSAAVVAAHNHVLRRWLRGECAEPAEEVDRALGHVMALFGMRHGRLGGRAALSKTKAPGGSTYLVAFESELPLSDIIPALERAIGPKQ